MQPQEFSLKGDLTFASVDLMRFDFIRKIEASKQSVLSVDLKEVLHTDTAGLALMLEGIKTARGLGKVLSYYNLPSALLKLAQFCNVEILLSPSSKRIKENIF